MRSTRVSSVLPCGRASRSNGASSRPARGGARSRRPGARRPWRGAPRRACATRGTASRCPRYSISSPSSRCSTRVIERSSSAMSWLTTSSAPRYDTQELHQPVLRVDVEVVGRLVEQEQVAPGEQDPGELDTAALAAGEDGDGKVDAVGRQAEAGHDATRLRVGRVPAVVAVRLLQARVPRDRPLGRAFLHLQPRLLEVHGGLREAAGLEDVGQRGVPGLLAGQRFLREVAEGARRAGSGRRPPGTRRRASSAARSCRRRCARPGRPCRRRAG